MASFVSEKWWNHPQWLMMVNAIHISGICKVNDGSMGISMVNDGWMGISMGILWCWIMLNYVEFQLNIANFEFGVGIRPFQGKWESHFLCFIAIHFCDSVAFCWCHSCHSCHSHLTCSSIRMISRPARQLNILYRGLELLKVGGRLVRALGTPQLTADQRDS